MIRSGKPSSGIRRHKWWEDRSASGVPSRDVQPSETTTQRVMQNCLSTLSYFWCLSKEYLDGVTALRVTTAKNRFWNANGSLTAIVQTHSYSVSLSLFLPPSHSLALFLSVYTNISLSLVCLDVRWCLSRREASLLEKIRDVVVRFSFVRIKEDSPSRWKTIRTTFDLTIMIAAQQTLLEEQRLRDTYYIIPNEYDSLSPSNTRFVSSIESCTVLRT